MQELIKTKHKFSETPMYDIYHKMDQLFVSMQGGKSPQFGPCSGTESLYSKIVNKIISYKLPLRSMDSPSKTFSISPMHWVCTLPDWNLHNKIIVQMDLEFCLGGHQQTDEINKSNTISVLFQLCPRFIYVTLFSVAVLTSFGSESKLFHVMREALGELVSYEKSCRSLATSYSAARWSQPASSLYDCELFTKDGLLGSKGEYIAIYRAIETLDVGEGGDALWVGVGEAFNSLMGETSLEHRRNNNLAIALDDDKHQNVANTTMALPI